MKPDVFYSTQAEFQRSPLDGATPLERAWPYTSAMPGKQLARRIRDARLLREVGGGYGGDLICIAF
jgi:hypothetical protein